MLLSVSVVNVVGSKYKFLVIGHLDAEKNKQSQLRFSWLVPNSLHKRINLNIQYRLIKWGPVGLDINTV